MKNTERKSRLWLWFVAGAVLHVGVWSAWIVVASKNRVAEVPLATTRGR